MDENIIKRIMPHSHEAEQSVIGSMIMDRDAIIAAVDRLSPEDFYEREFQVMFETMKALFSEDKAVDVTTLIAGLKERDLAPEFTSIEHVSGIVDATPTSANIRHYVDIVYDKSIERNFIRSLEKLTNTLYSDKENVDAVIEEAEKEVFNISRKRGTADFEEIQKVVYRALRQMEEAARNKSRVTGVPSGFRDLDYKTAGFHGSELIIIAARPAMGKTALELNIANNAAVRNKITTVIFSLEMSKESLINRMLSMNSKVDSSNIRTGDLKDQDWVDIMAAGREISDSNLLIDDTPQITVAELRSKCRKLKLEKNLGLIIIDYLQLMSGSGRAESRQQEISEISRSLKSLARELDCPVIALSQLSRALEQRPDKRPMMSDLRESGAIEQDADLVMFIYRDEVYYPNDTKDPGVAEIIIGKQRSGPTGTVRLKWQPEFTRFANLEQRPKEDAGQ